MYHLLNDLPELESCAKVIIGISKNMDVENGIEVRSEDELKLK